MSGVGYRAGTLAEIERTAGVCGDAESAGSARRFLPGVSRSRVTMSERSDRPNGGGLSIPE